MEKKNLEDLSNLEFGLALTIGAITLIQPADDDLAEMVSILLRFALSFLVIIWIWLIYNTTMGRLHGEHKGLLALNVVLLFFVAVEPYLLTTVDKVSGATLYAFNLGTTLIILALSITISSRREQGGRSLVSDSIGSDATCWFFARSSSTPPSLLGMSRTSQESRPRRSRG